MTMIPQLRQLGLQYLRDRDHGAARMAFSRIIKLDPGDIHARFVYAQLIEDGTHARHAEARDLMLDVLDEQPAILEHATETNLALIRGTAQRCSHVGPFDRAIELYRKLANLSGLAADWFALSEILTQHDLLDEALASLRKAMELDPAAYDTPAHRETLETAGAIRARVTRIGRYPTTEAFRGDLQALVRDHVAVNLGHEAKFMDASTRFFTMGSCFARNLSMALTARGYTSAHMEISEYINTTFANRVFVDWLRDADIDHAIGARIAELLPPGWSRENTLEVISNGDVFILTLGVAAAFFDRQTGAFVLPRPSALNSRALAEKYLFRNASVEENVDNVLYLLRFVRSINPAIRIVVTVSPVPLLASFAHESAVQADCLSKCTMRLVADQVVNSSGLQNILYWPSFEIFRWAGSQVSPFYAADDGAAWHVSEDKVAGTVQAFVEMFDFRLSAS